MRLHIFVAGVAVLIVALAPGEGAAQDSPSIDLVLNAGRPLRVALDRKVSVKHVGQPIMGTVIEPVFAYDRIVIPAGSKVRGHIAHLTRASPGTRVRGYLGGDFSPPRQVVVRFDTLVLADGREMPLDTVVTGGVPNVKRAVASGSGKTREMEADPDANDSATSRAGRAVRQRGSDAITSVKQQASDTLAAIKGPGKMGRLKDAVVARLPVHPQYLAQGVVYDATLVSPLNFGAAVPTPRAPAGTAPAPDSILTARLATPLDSSKTPRGTPLEAVLTEPVFSSEHQLILPEGTTLTGEVTLAKQARRFQRNGQLRFLVEQVHAPDDAASTPMLAALYSVQASGNDHVAVDEEGGTALKNSKTRFIAPALGLVSLRASLDREHRYADPDGDGSIHTAGGGGIGNRGIGGFLGAGLLGAAVSQVSRPVGLTLAVVGVGRTVYTHIFSKGREVSFPADTPIQVRLAPGPPPAP